MKFQVNIEIDGAKMQDQVDVANALRRVSDRLCKFSNTYWGPYALHGEVKDEDGKVVGKWEVLP